MSREPDMLHWLREALGNAPMPDYDGPEPSEIDVARIRRYVDEDRFDDLPKWQQRWVCRRLMPSLARFGTYPPPTGHDK